MARTIKTTLELGGEAAYKKGLASVDRALKTMSRELSDATAKFAENSKSLSNITGVSNAYKNSIEQQKVKVDSLKEAVETSSKAYEEAVENYEKAAAANGENSAETLKAADALYKAEAAMDGYKSKLASAEKYLESTQKKMSEFSAENKNLLVLAQAVDKVKEKISNLTVVKKVTETFDKLKSKISEIVGRNFPTFISGFNKIKTIARGVKGAFELVVAKAKAIGEKLKPVVSICGNVAKAAAKISFKAAETGAKAMSAAVKTAATAFTGYTTAAAGLVTATMSTIESTREYRNDLAKLEQGAATSGNSFDKMKQQLSGLSALTGETDSSIEALSNLMATGFSDSQISQAVESLSGAVIKFPDTLKIESLADSLQETIATGKGTGQFAELIERNGDSLDDFNAGLETCTSTAERQQYALEYLGNSGLAAVTKEYEKSHKALLDYEKAEQAVTDANAKIAESAMPVSAAFKQGYAGVLSAFADILTGADSTGAQFSQKITAFVSSISTLITQYAPTILLAVNIIIQSVIANLPTLIATILPPLIDGFNSLVTGIIEIIPEVLPLLLEGFLTLFTSLIDSLNTVIDLLVPMLPKIITQISALIVENLPTLLQGAKQLFMGIIQSLETVADELMPMLPMLVSNICQMLINNLPSIISTGFDLLVGLINGITNCIPTLLQKIPEIISHMVTTFTSEGCLGNLITAGFDLISAVAEGLPTAIPQLLQNIPEIVTSIVDALLEQDWLQLGIDILKGIAQGLVAGVSAISETIESVGQSVVNKFKNFFGIASPSKLFKKEVGVFLAQGIGVGFEDEMGKVTKQMSNAVPSDFDTVVNADIHNVSKTKTAPVSGVSKTTNVNYIFENVTINNDRDIEENAYKLELMRRKAEIAMGGI